MPLSDYDDEVFDPEGPGRRRPKPGKSGTHLLLWILGGFLGFVFLCCAGILGLVFYIGAVGPDTSVYSGNQVPVKYVNIMKEDGALREGETLLFFYSDALTDIRDGYYLVTDRSVAIYSNDAVDELRRVTFDDIEEAELHRDTSFFEDSTITLFLKEGEILSFPVSSEQDRDQLFFDEIQERLPVPEAAPEQ